MSSGWIDYIQEENRMLKERLGALGRYYADYDRLMCHWKCALPLPIFDLSCRKFNETTREVRTPSRWQVKQPIYALSIGRWKHYESHLDVLKQALGSLA